jgi:hypothetical protein
MELTERPKVITLCGSSRFREQHEQAQRDLTLKGYIVIPMGLYGHLEGLDMDGSIKKMLDQLHFRKIDISDAIFVVNSIWWRCKVCKGFAPFNSKQSTPKIECDCPPGWGRGEFASYIGESTRNEIEYAKLTNKEVIYLNAPESQE